MQYNIAAKESPRSGRPSVELLDHAPPHDAKAEQAVLGSIMLAPDRLDEVAGIISPVDFHDAIHAAVFRSMLGLQQQGQPVDHVTLLGRLGSHPLIGDRAKAMALIGELANSTPTAAHAGHYAQLIQQAARKRRARETAITLLQAIASGKDADEATADARAELESLSRDGSTGIQYELLTSAELDEADYPLEYIIDGMLVLGQPCIAAGGKKCLKTTILVAIGISIATGVPLFDVLRVNRTCRVLMMSGESGLATLQETVRRICRAVGVNPRDIDNLFWSAMLPKFGDQLHIDAFRRLIEDNELEVVVIDPAYLCMPGADAGNLFLQGELLRDMNEVCQANGTTLIIAHHTRKGGKADPFSPPELEDIAWAGFQEWARQWVLIGRREAYDPGDRPGEHKLWINCGGSAGHSSLWALDVSEGTHKAPGGRHWRVDLKDAREARQDAAEREEAARQEKRDAKIETHQRRILDVLAKLKRGTKTDIKDRSGLSGTQFNIAWAELLGEGFVAEDGEITKGNNRSYPAFTLPKEGQPDNRTTQPDSGNPDAQQQPDSSPIRGCPGPVAPVLFEESSDSVRMQDDPGVDWVDLS